MLVSVPRRHSLRHPATEDAEHRTRGPWWWRTDTPTTTARLVWVTCPNGHLWMLRDDIVGAAGVVLVPLVCGVVGCGWDVEAVLDGWKEAVVSRETR